LKHKRHKRDPENPGPILLKSERSEGRSVAFSTRFSILKRKRSRLTIIKQRVYAETFLYFTSRKVIGPRSRDQRASSENAKSLVGPNHIIQFFFTSPSSLGGGGEGKRGGRGSEIPSRRKVPAAILFTSDITRRRGSFAEIGRSSRFCLRGFPSPPSSPFSSRL